MKKSVVSFLSVVAAGLCLVPNARADLRVKSKYTAGNQSSETTVYSRGPRQRFEPAPGMAIINQNDVKRTVQIFDEKKMYMIMSAEMLSRALPAVSPAAASAPTPSTPKGGGVVNVTIAITDTGERKQMFGYTARHVKNTITITAGNDTCEPGNETIETDGWYIDYTPEDAPAGIAPPTIPTTPAAVPTSSSCKDDVRVNQTGTGAVGYPLAYAVKTSTKEGKATEMSMEVVEFSASPLDAALFEVPPGYTELKGFADMSAMLAGGPAASKAAGASAAARAGAASAATLITPKAPGAIRVGVADIGNRAGKDLGGGSPRDQLVSELMNEKVDAVPLTGSSAAEVEAAAKKLEADYILYTDVTEVKKAGGGGLGGLVSKASAITGGSKEKLEAKVDYRLSPLDGSKPLLAASAKGTNSSGGLGLPGALGLATNIASMGMLGKMGMFNPNMMKLFGGMGANMGAAGMNPSMSAMMRVPGMPRGGMDPSLAPFMVAMSATQTAMTPPQPTEDGKAVIDAFADTAKKVADAIKKKK